MTAAAAYFHPAALCECDDVGAGTRIWAFAHVMAGAHVGRDCNIGDHAFIESGAWIGDGVTIKNGVMVWDGVRIEDGAFIGPGATFTNDRRPRSPRAAETGAAARYAAPGNWLEPTTVGRCATIGARAVILPGLAIGAFAMVAAGAVVTRSVGAHALVSGNPARPAGFVGRGGTKLVAGKDGSLRCPETGDRFRIDGDSAVPLDA